MFIKVLITNNLTIFIMSVLKEKMQSHAVTNICGAMEADTISKHGRNLKSRTSKENYTMFMNYGL